MIIEMEIHHTLAVAEMLQAMTEEVFPAHASSELSVYLDYVSEARLSDTKWIFVDTELNGFFMVVDDLETIAPTHHRHLATKVYVKPAKRNSRLLFDFYELLYSKFDEVIGVTEIGSRHIPVLEKRHERVANVYRITKDRRR